MKNIHDNHFKQLLAERSFFEAFMKTYLPADLLEHVDWHSLHLYKMGGIHQEKNTRKEYESDAIYLVKIKEEDHFIWLHVEHQSTPDKCMALRILQYQAAELLTYAKQNPGKTLPAILSFIYHQGEKQWPYSLNLYDLFTNPELAMRYLGKPLLIDLPLLSDHELQQHAGIGSVEMALKYVRQKDFTRHLRQVLSALGTTDDKSLEIVLQYVIHFTDIPQREFIHLAMECLPHDKETIMISVAKQWEAEGFQRGISLAKQWKVEGMQQGKQEGAEHERLNIARNMLTNGLQESMIEKITGVSLARILQLKEEIGN